MHCRSRFDGAVVPYRRRQRSDDDRVSTCAHHRRPSPADDVVRIYGEYGGHLLPPPLAYALLLANQNRHRHLPPPRHLSSKRRVTISSSSPSVSLSAYRRRRIVFDVAVLLSLRVPWSPLRPLLIKRRVRLCVWIRPPFWISSSLYISLFYYYYYHHHLRRCRRHRYTYRRCRLRYCAPQSDFRIENGFFRIPEQNPFLLYPNNPFYCLRSAIVWVFTTISRPGTTAIFRLHAVTIVFWFSQSMLL